MQPWSCRPDSPGPAAGAATALAGFAAAMIALTFLLEGEERKIRIWLALVASLGITYGGWLATRERPTAAAPPAPPGGPPPAAG